METKAEVSLFLFNVDISVAHAGQCCRYFSRILKLAVWNTDLSSQPFTVTLWYFSLKKKKHKTYVLLFLNFVHPPI